MKRYDIVKLIKQNAMCVEKNVAVGEEGFIFDVEETGEVIVFFHERLTDVSSCDDYKHDIVRVSQQNLQIVKPFDPDDMDMYEGKVRPIQEYDIVELTKDRAEYLAAGVKKGDRGWVNFGNRNGFRLVMFDGETQHIEGIDVMVENPVGVFEEDLIVVKRNIPNSLAYLKSRHSRK